MSAMIPQSAPSLYEEIGGNKTINKAVDYFYEAIRYHKRLAQFFAPINSRMHSAHQKAYIAHLLGGFPNFQDTTTIDTTKDFEDMRLTQADVQELNKIIEEALLYAGINQNLIERIMALLTQTKDEIINEKYGLF